MILTNSLPLFVTIFLLCHTVMAQELPNARSFPAVERAHDYDATVVPIAGLKSIGPGVEADLGTGFCLDPECRFIVTNYHVATVASPRKIQREKIINRYLDTGPDDEGATVNDGAYSGPMKFTLSRDLALFELRHPLAHHYGARFSLDDLQLGQEVDIYAYPKTPVNPLRRLMCFRGTFKGETTTGLLSFEYLPLDDKYVGPGASGGIVVEAKSQEIVGVLNAVGVGDQRIALAVPIPSLVDFVSKVQPCVAQRIFPLANDGFPTEAPDFYPKFAPPPAIGALQTRPEEPVEVKALRAKAQLLADSIRNFIAVQTFSWGSGDQKPAASAAYEVRVIDGCQRFREYPDGKKYLNEAPLAELNRDISTGGDWAELPELVGTELRVKIHQAPEVVTSNQRFKVFQYWADKEDALPECKLLTTDDFDFFKIKRISTNSCYGEVWTDEESNVRRISLHVELTGKWKNHYTVVTYGWLRRENDVPRLIPITISAQAEYNKKVYWCRGRFFDYHVFTSQVKMAAN